MSCRGPYYRRIHSRFVRPKRPQIAYNSGHPQSALYSLVSVEAAGGVDSHRTDCIPPRAVTPVRVKHLGIDANTSRSICTNLTRPALETHL